MHGRAVLRFLPLPKCSIEKSNVGFYSQINFFFFVKKIFTISLQCPFMASQILNPPIPKYKVLGSWNGLDLLVPLFAEDTKMELLCSDVMGHGQCGGNFFGLHLGPGLFLISKQSIFKGKFILLQHYAPRADSG